MKRLFLCLISAFVVCSVYCQSNYETARGFMLKKGVKLSSEALNGERSDGCEVFKTLNGNGYAIVKDNVIIAYSTEEPYSNYTLKSSTRSLKLTPKAPIEPMIEAEFVQNGSPYTDSLPDKRSVGCGGLAVAKIMYYYKNQFCDAIDEVKFGKEKIPDLEALPSTTFNWDNILPKYRKGNYTEEQGKEVAKLMKYVGYAVHSEYNKYSTGSWVLPQWLMKLGFSDETYTTVGGEYEVGTNEWWQSYDEWKMSDEELEALLDYELEQGRPVMIAGYDKSLTTGHWQIIDGRDDTGRYHVDTMGYVIVSQDMCADYEVPPFGYANQIYHSWCVVPIVSQSTNLPQITNKVKEDSNVYKLQGHKVGNSLEGVGKGVYIRNGKKYLVK